MNDDKSDLQVSRKPNLTRVFQGIDIYRDAMRHYIAQTMERREPGGDWFFGLVVPALSETKQVKIGEYMDDNLINLLDVSDFPRVVRNNRRVFPSYLTGERSKAVTWMYEISAWRNDLSHPPTDDFSGRDADRALETCARVLQLIGAEEEGKRVGNLFDDPQATLKLARNLEEQAKKKGAQVQEEINQARQEKEETQRMREAAQEERTQAQRERDEAARKHDAAARERMQAQRERNEAQRMVDQAQQDMKEARQQRAAAQDRHKQMDQELEEAKQRLEGEQRAHTKTKQTLADTQAELKEIKKERNLLLFTTN